MTRGFQAGVKMANAVVELIHLMYQKRTARKVLSGLISRLEERKREFSGNKDG